MKKYTGIVRAIDELGRIVLPMELRKTMNISSGDKLEIHVDEEGQIILSKHQCTCSFCRSNEDIINFEGKCICKKCISELKKL